MQYGRTAGIGCGVVLALGLASGASAQVTPVVAGATITAAGINAIIDAVNGVATSVHENLSLPATTSTTGQVLVNGTRFLHSFGLRNTFLGANAGNVILTGNDNTAGGNEALLANTIGSRNTAVGASALDSNIDGSFNTAVGELALRNNIDGIANTAVGEGTLRDNTTGSRNTAVGEGTLLSNIDGSRNTAVGEGAGRNSTGSNNIYLGANVRGVFGESDTMYLGQVGTQTRAFIAGVRGITTGMANAVDVVIDGSGQLGTVSSSRRYKKDIQDMGRASAGLLELRPITFRYTQAFADGATPTQYGLIAEEVAEIYPDVVVYNDAGQAETVQYRKVNAMLLNEVQRQHRQIAAQQEQIDAFLTRLVAVERRLDTN